MMYANINRNKQEISLIIGKCYLNRDIEKEPSVHRVLNFIKQEIKSLRIRTFLFYQCFFINNDKKSFYLLYLHS
jgi:hypothetical protein